MEGIDEGKTCIECHKGIAHKLPDTQAVIEEAVLLLVWAGVASVVRRAGHVILRPGPRRSRLLSEMTNKNPYIIYLSALTRDP